MSSPWHSSTSIYSSVLQHWSQTERLQPAGRQPYRPVLTASDHAPEPYPRLHAWYPPPGERHAKQCSVSAINTEWLCVVVRQDGAQLIWIMIESFTLNQALYKWLESNPSLTMIYVGFLFKFLLYVSKQRPMSNAKTVNLSEPDNMTLRLQRGMYSPRPPVPVSAADDGCWWGWEVDSLPLLRGLQLGQTWWYKNTNIQWLGKQWKHSNPKNFMAEALSNTTYTYIRGRMINCKND